MGFRTKDNKLFALDNYDPFSQANVLYRELIGGTTVTNDAGIDEAVLPHLFISRDLTLLLVNAWMIQLSRLPLTMLSLIPVPVLKVMMWW